MKRLLAALIIALSASACRQNTVAPAESYRRWTDRMIVETGLAKVGVAPCPPGKTDMGSFTAYASMPADQCYKTDAPQRWRGVLVLGPYEEGEQFCPGAAQPCRWEKHPRYELQWSHGALKARSPTLQWGRSYAVDLVGRRTAYIGNLDDGDFVVVVDRLISAKDVGPSPP